jgi:LmbE family N-acetylglucosaminyl deacetylase
MNDSSEGACWLNTERALVLCPHTDDELGCAGLILRLLERGTKVMFYALSRCEASVPPPYPENTLELECRNATAALCLPADQVSILRYPVRHFPQHRQDILELFVKINKEMKPQLVIMPSSFDNHQDHATVYQEGFRAFKHSTMLGYELPQNLISFSNTAFVTLSEQHLRRKIEALSKYESQKFRPYTTADFISSLAKVRGMQCNALYAEAYEVVRLIL